MLYYSGIFTNILLMSPDYGHQTSYTFLKLNLKCDKLQTVISILQKRQVKPGTHYYFFPFNPGLNGKKSLREACCTNYATLVQRSPHWAPPLLKYNGQHWQPLTANADRMLSSVRQAGVHMGWILVGFCWTSLYQPVFHPCVPRTGS